jgi:HSF-type DNA-binding
MYGDQARISALLAERQAQMQAILRSMESPVASVPAPHNAAVSVHSELARLGGGAATHAALPPSSRQAQDELALHQYYHNLARANTLDSLLHGAGNNNANRWIDIASAAPTPAVRMYDGAAQLRALSSYQYTGPSLLNTPRLPPHASYNPYHSLYSDQYNSAILASQAQQLSLLQQSRREATAAAMMQIQQLHPSASEVANYQAELEAQRRRGLADFAQAGGASSNNVANSASQPALQPSEEEEKETPASLNQPQIDDGNIQDDSADNPGSSAKVAGKKRRRKGQQNSETQPQGSARRPDNSPGQKKTENFVQKLYRLIIESEEQGLGHIVSFCPSGKAFHIHDRQAFVEQVASRFFRSVKFNSFKRQLYWYHFQRHKSGPDEGAYFHVSFQKGRLDLLHKVRRCEDFIERRIKDNESE